jgi:hypothetical protein
VLRFEVWTAYEVNSQAGEMDYLRSAEMEDENYKDKEIR